MYCLWCPVPLTAIRILAPMCSHSYSDFNYQCLNMDSSKLAKEAVNQHYGGMDLELYGLIQKHKANPSDHMQGTVSPSTQPDMILLQSYQGGMNLHRLLWVATPT